MFGNNVAALRSDWSIEFSSNGGYAWSPIAAAKSGEILYGQSSIAATGNSVYVASLFKGLFISRDKGNTWAQYSTANGLSNNRVSSVAFACDTIYAGTTNGIEESKDDGKTWKNIGGGKNVARLFVVPSENCALENAVPEDQQWCSQWCTYTNDIDKTVIKPGVYIVPGEIANVKYSPDDGKTWKKVVAATNFLPYGNKIYAALTSSAFAVSDDGGKTWKTIDQKTLNSHVYKIRMHKHKVYAVKSDSPGKRNDLYVVDGNSLKLINPPTQIAKDAEKTIDLTCDDILMATPSQLFASKDEGKTWKLIDKIGGFKKLDASGNSVVSLRTDGTIDFSSDGGYSWKPIPAAKSGEILYGQSSIVSTGNYIYIGTLFKGLFISRDKGITWTQYSTANGLPNNRVSAVAFACDKIYAGTGKGVQESNDYGKTWKSIGGGKDIQRLYVIPSEHCPLAIY